MSASAVLRLQKVGFSAEQVEASADFMDTQAASKADLEAGLNGVRLQIEELDHRLSSRIEEVEHRLSSRIDAGDHRLELKITELQSELCAQEQRLTITMGGMMVVAVGVIVALVKLLPGGHP